MTLGTIMVRSGLKRLTFGMPCPMSRARGITSGSVPIAGKRSEVSRKSWQSAIAGLGIRVRWQTHIHLGSLSAMELPHGVRRPSRFGQTRTLFGSGRDQDLYSILEVDRSASAKDIKKAYFRLAKKYHPDLNPGDPNARVQFHRIAAAYEVLSDSSRRRLYDMTGQHDNQEHFNESYSSSYSATAADDFAKKVFEKVWQDLGLREYVETVQSEASTALEAARHGDYSFAWEFAKARKGLILSALVPFAVAFRFPGVVGGAVRFLGLFAIVFLRNLPPGMAWAIMRNAWIRITRR